MAFAAGDLVTCIYQGDAAEGMQYGQVFRVEGTHPIHGLKLKDVPNWWASTRFTHVETPRDTDARPDDIHRPAHYTRWNIEPVEFLLRNEVPGHIFNIVKYTMRAGYKVPEGMTKVEAEIMDLKKAIRYAEMRINLLEGKETL